MVRVRPFPSLGGVSAVALCALLLSLAILPTPGSVVPTSAGVPSGLRPLAAPPLPHYPVTFTESGLPSGATWTVTLGNASHSSTQPSILFYVPNGTYPYSIGSVGGYVPAQPSGNLTVQGGNNTVVGTLNVPNSRPWGGAARPYTGNVFMAYDQRGNLSVINGTTNVNQGNIPVGRSPDTPVWDPIDQDVYVANWGSNNVTVVDPTTHVRVANVTVGTQPLTAVFDPAGGAVYVANYGGNSVSVLNGTNHMVVATLPVGTQPTGLAYDPITGDVYATNYGSDNVSVLGGTPSKVLASIPLPAHSGPFGIAYDSAVNRLFVTQQGTSACTGGGGPCYGSLINASTNAYAGSFVEGPGAAYPSFDPDNGLLYIPNAVSPGTITVLSSPTGPEVALIPVGNSPESVAVDLHFGTLYSANLAANTISIINGRVYDESVAFVPRPPALYPVNFTESGLPAGTSWSVEVNGTRYGATGATISASEKNGTYPFVVQNVSGFRVAPTSGSLVVNGTNVTTSIVFTPLPPPTYPISFAETGLPNGTVWSVSLNGTLLNSTGALISFSRANGSYLFLVPKVPGYTVSPSSGTVPVNGSGAIVLLAYSAIPPALYPVLFRENGLPSGTVWSVNLSGVLLDSNGSSISVSRANGTYAYVVPSVPGYLVSPNSGSVVVNGANSTVTLGFSPIPQAQYSITFRERGLSSNTTWSIAVGSASMSGDSTILSLNETNGTYAFGVGTISGFSVAPSSGLVTVNGSAQTVSVWFNASTTGGGSGLTWGNGNYGFFGRNVIAFLAFLVAVALAIVLALLVLQRRRKAKHAGVTVASIAAEAGFPSSFAAGATSTTPPVPEDPGAPPHSLPPPPPRRPEPPPPKPDWVEE